MKQEKLNTKIRQKQIADVCLEIISERGLAALNVAEVASKLGLVTSALYRHYKDKEQMVSAILQIIRKRVKADFVKAEKQGRDAFEKLEMLLNIESDRLHERRAFQMIIFSDSTLQEKYNKLTEIRSIVSEFRAATLSIFERGQEAGDIRNDISSDTLEKMFVNLFLTNVAMHIIDEDEFDINDYHNKAWSVFKEMIST
jgi:TetR/AcrR family transcriptional regulator, fatty acid metabolism regulator protein